MIVWYVAGYGRSGSTVLGTLLQALPKVVHVGELGELPRVVQAGELCSCGRIIGACDHWSQILHSWRGERDRESLETLSRYDTGGQLHRVRRLVCDLVRDSCAVDEYLGETKALLEAIRLHTGAEVIVDSSKDPLRAVLLSRIDGLDLRVVHLTRDCRAVSASLLKSHNRALEKGVGRTIQRRPVWQSAAAWTVRNAQIEVLLHWIGLGGRVRHEDIGSDVVGTVRRLVEDLGWETSPTEMGLEGPLEVGHIVAGNRLRMQGKVSVQMPTGAEGLTHLQRVTATVVGGPLLRRYGYTRRSHRGFRCAWV